MFGPKISRLYFNSSAGFEMKSDKISEQCRAEGNKFYKGRNFFEALVNYNESLCNASSGSENLGHAFANRSAVYFELKLYGNSIKNIELARSHNYPQKNFEVLDKRAEKCRLMMRHQISVADHWRFFKLSFKPHKRLPFVANCCELGSNEKYGKHIVTNQAVKVGDILAIERPFCSVLLSESRFIEVDKFNKFQRCGLCLIDNQLDLLPCEGCCDGKF